MDKEMEGYLSGAKFSNSRKFKLKIQNEKTLDSRNNSILSFVKGKKILHLGCVDHENLIGQSNWLHEKIDKLATRCLGVDINQNGLAMLSEMGYTDLVCGDITSSELIPEIVSDKWDYILICDVLEHIDNPVHFLQMIKHNYGNHIDNFIITVPNYLNWNNVKNSIRNIEKINTDHRYWFSIFTISKVLVLSKYNIEEIRLVMNGEVKNRGLLTRFLLKRYFQLRDTLFVRGSLGKVR
jgi:hypothetical protein